MIALLLEQRTLKVADATLEQGGFEDLMLTLLQLFLRALKDKLPLETFVLKRFIVYLNSMKSFPQPVQLILYAGVHCLLLQQLILKNARGMFKRALCLMFAL
mmetsp:Transcript_101593/g.226929  ORF Transcript_101593/g.226929 Transcript_101593/m.226929 type:complete len:102 (-) Transcript_101593:362-667(-)